MNRSEKAESLFLGGCNCCQSVFLAFQDLINLDEGTMLRLSAPFGGGGAGTRELCGALSGMMMVMGQLTATEDYRDNAAKTALYRHLQAMMDEFEQEHGSCQCAQLLKLAKGYRPDPSLRTPEYYKSRPCARLVGSAARIIQKELDASFPPQEEE